MQDKQVATGGDVCSVADYDELKDAVEVGQWAHVVAVGGSLRGLLSVARPYG